MKNKPLKNLIKEYRIDKLEKISEKLSHYQKVGWRIESSIEKRRYDSWAVSPKGEIWDSKKVLEKKNLLGEGYVQSLRAYNFIKLIHYRNKGLPFLFERVFFN